jgi:hypothetical protein
MNVLNAQLANFVVVAVYQSPLVTALLVTIV